jgi:hypothetical protein
LRTIGTGSVIDWVLPPVNGGLHCGTYYVGCKIEDWMLCSRSQRRTPLRRDLLRVRCVHHDVLLLFHGWLHCSTGFREDELPPPRAGNNPLYHPVDR